MALAATTIWEVESGASDTLNGGAFDPGQTAGMLTDGAATVATTAAPVFTSASYNFVAGDVGAWVYISSGTNWTAGWYKIASVAANAATLTAGVGTAVLKSQLSMNAVAGCATVASPTSATWTIDYSQQAAAKTAYTDLASAGAGLTVTSALAPFGKQQVGNSIVITGGTNFNTGRFVIASVSVVTATVLGAGNITSGVGASGTGGLGGALTTPGQSLAAPVNGNNIFIKQATYSLASATPNIATGVLSVTTTSVIVGYNTNRILTNTDTKPILQTNVTTATSYTGTTVTNIYNVAFDGNGQTAAKAIGNAVDAGFIIRCTFTGFNTASVGGNYINCSATINSAAVLAGNLFDCEAYANTATPILLMGNGGIAVNCLSYSNTGSSTDGIQLGGSQFIFNSTTYANGRDGITNGAGTTAGIVMNCHSEQNVRNDYNLLSTSSAHPFLINSSYFFTGSGAGVTANTSLIQIGIIVLTSTAFTNAAGLDFSPNSVAGGGASIRAASYVGQFPHASTISYLDTGAVQHLSAIISAGLAWLKLIGVGRF